MTKQHPQL